MRTTTRAALVSALVASAAVLGSRASRAADPEPPGDPQAPIKVDGHDVSKMSKIEDASLEGLLDLSLEEQLGKTEAVSRTSESVLRAPATVTTLDATQIRLSGATNVPELLRFVPGVSVVRNAPGNYVVSLRGTGGLAGNNIILLIDGIPINNPLDGTVSWDFVPLDVEDIESIEVVRGPVSPIYGANAYTGVVNITTRTTGGIAPRYAARLRGGSGLQGGPGGSASARFVHIGKRLELKWFATVTREGTLPRSGASSAVAFDGRPDIERAATLAAISYRLGKAGRASFEVGLAASRRSSMDHLALDSEQLSQSLIFGRALYDLQGVAGSQSQLRLWGQGISVSMSSRQDANTGFSYDGARGLRGSAGADLVVPVGSALSLQLGGQGSLERIVAPFVHPNASGAVRPAYGFYGGIKASPTSSLDLIVTGRGDLAPIAAKLEYSYRASAVYHAETWGLRLTGASAFRAPSYVEAAGRFVDPATGFILLEGTADIAAPRNTSVELGATFAPSSRLTVSPTAYVSRLTSLMVEDFDSVLRRTFHNSPNARTFVGAEIEANWRVRDAVSILPSFGVLKWLDTEQADTNVGVPSQNSRYIAGIRLQGVFGNDRWGYGVGGTVASARNYQVRAGIPPVVIAKEIPTTARLSAMLEHQLLNAPAIWGSLRIAGSIPGDAAESPLPLATPMGQSAILGLEVRRE